MREGLFCTMTVASRYINVLWIVLACGQTVISSNPDHARLHDLLFSGYNPDVIPSMSHDTPVVLKIFPTLVKLNNNELSSGTMVSTLSLTMTWTDPRLKWGPSNFGNTTQIYTSLRSLWSPDVRVHDIGQGQNEDLFDDHDLAVVMHSGTITYARIINLKFLCLADYFHFPFDERHCYLTIGSWVYTARQIRLSFWHTNSFSTNLDYTTDKPQFDITPTEPWKLTGEKARGVLKNVTHECCPDDPNTLLQISIRVKRQPGWMAVVLTLSVIVTAFLVPLQFCLSPQSDTRLLHGFAVLLLSSLNVACLTYFLPTSQIHVPKIGISIIGNVILSTTTITVSVLVTVMSQKWGAGKSPPQWLRQIVIPLYPLFCVQINTKSHPNQSKLSKNYKLTNHVNSERELEAIPLHETPDQSSYHASKDGQAPYERPCDVYNDSKYVLEQLVALLEKSDNRLSSDWDYIITTIDRLCLISVSVISVIFIIVALV